MAKRDSKLTESMLLEEISQLRQQQKTLILASQSEDATQQLLPLASYAPYIEDAAGNFYLLLSGLAGHSVNLQQHHDKHSLLSILLIEDEQNSRNIFARKRLSYFCTVTIYSREHVLWPEKIAQLQAKFGKTIEVLASLGDFKLYCLTPQDGNYVRGFGQAYDLRDGRHPVLRQGN